MKRTILIFPLFLLFPMVLAATQIMGGQLVNAQSPSQSTSSTPVMPNVPTFPTPAVTPAALWDGPYYEIPLALSPHDHFLFSIPVTSQIVEVPKPDFRYGAMYPDDNQMHTGFDFAADLHQPVHAAGAGKVVFAGYGLLNGDNDKKDPYGIAVMIRHSFSFDGYTLYSVYAHLEKTLVNNGQWIENGDTVGLVGLTGLTSGPHLHLEIRIQKEDDTRTQNPELWLVPQIGKGVLSGRITNNYGTLLGNKEIWLKSLENEDYWKIITYSPSMEDRDDYFQENYVLNDLPSGYYEISTYYYYKYYKAVINIVPGTVNYVNFVGHNGFNQATPALPNPTDFLK